MPIALPHTKPPRTKARQATVMLSQVTLSTFRMPSRGRKLPKIPGLAPAGFQAGHIAAVGAIPGLLHAAAVQGQRQLSCKL